MAAEGIDVVGARVPGSDEILTEEALAFVAELHRRFAPNRAALLARRVKRQAELDAGVMPDFRPDTEAIRNADWTVATAPADLDDRRVRSPVPPSPR